MDSRERRCCVPSRKPHQRQARLRLQAEAARLPVILLALLQFAGDEVAFRGDLVVRNVAAVVHDRQERLPGIAEDVALRVLVDRAARARVVDVDEPVGVALAVRDDLGGDAEPALPGVVEDLRDVRPAQQPADEQVYQRANPRQDHRYDGLDEVEQRNDRLNDVAADEPRHELQHRLQYVRPAADDVCDNVADILADVLTAAVAAEDAAEEVTDSADDTADGTAHILDDGIADIGQYRGEDLDKLLDDLADLDQQPLDHRHYDLNQPDYRLKH